MEADDPQRRQRMVETAGEALAAAQAGDDGAAITLLTTYVDSAPDGEVDGRELVLMLFRECSEMVSALGSGGATPVKMQVYDASGEEVSIDEADPPVRTAVRTLLAQVHGDQDAARAQIEIALSSAEPPEVAAVVMQALRWTIRLADECTKRDLPVAEWISAALAED
ncbi:hypothetical protein BC739_003590 [Kutzneria viridogrisea]|uniref:TetR family transcriptional regulator n=1 Tax=Kutzneria viridogrisea TaxID=47990 RepID=A0ABR6BI81_9PSEU|nr:hypothetical protein [Kutzneria viridogrisea]